MRVQGALQGALQGECKAPRKCLAQKVLER